MDIDLLSFKSSFCCLAEKFFVLIVRSCSELLSWDELDDYYWHTPVKILDFLLGALSNPSIRQCCNAALMEAL